MLRLRLIRPFCTTRVVYAGHNKWSSIKHDKARNDALKNATATKFANSIAVASKLGGPDPTLNFKLATAIEQANKANVSKKVIENAIKRGSGNAGSNTGNVDFALYEGMVNGVSFVVESLTDNKARSAAMIKACFTKLSGSFAPTLYMFTKRGYIVVESSVDDIFDVAIEHGAEDIEEHQNGAIIYTPHQDTSKVAEALRSQYKVTDFGIEYSPNEDTAVPKSSLDDDKLSVHEKIIANLEDLDDVTHVYTNLV